MNPLICQAIKERRLLRIDYDPGERIIEPHTHGLSNQDNELLRAYQTSGASASNIPVDWKLLRVDRIRSIELLDEGFPGPRNGYRRGDFVMAEIFCQL